MRLIDADALETRLENECREWEGESAYQAGLCASAVIVAGAPTVKQEPSGWISVKDRLPEEDCEVIIYDADTKAVSIGCWIGRQFYEPYGYNPRPFENVTWWMLLPEKPKEDDDHD